MYKINQVDLLYKFYMISLVFLFICLGDKVAGYDGANYEYRSHNSYDPGIFVDKVHESYSQQANYYEFKCFHTSTLLILLFKRNCFGG